jgi:acetyl-CoA carboxylase biotin carboxyl carrier protein
MKIGGRGPPFPDAELIRTLAALLTETGLTEIEYAIGDRRVRVARIAAGPPASVPGVVSAPSVAAGSIENPGAVKAPMVGTAYLAPQPGAPPFVHLGDVVAEGQPLLIIEAMKVMNPIPAPHGGTVQEILFADGRPVEYGEVLMVVA